MPRIIMKKTPLIINKEYNRIPSINL